MNAPRDLRTCACPHRTIAAAALLAATALACVPTLKTPLKQALPSVLGEEGAAAPCLREVGSITLPGSVRGATLADLDGNGGLDLIALSYDGGVHALAFAFNDGRGQLARTTSLRLNGAPVAVEAADVNLDGRVDLMVASEPALDREPSALHVLLGDGVGGFIAGAVPLPFRPGALWAADLDGNDVSDALVLDEDGKSVALLIGDGRGEFAVKGRVRLPGTVEAAGVALVDLDGDRLSDLVTVHERGNGKAVLTVHRGEGDDFKAILRVELGQGAGAIAAGDVNRDGNQDLVALTDGAVGNPASAVLLLGNGVSELSFMGVRYFGPSPSRALRLVDISGDGSLDAVSLRASGEAVDTIPGDRRGGLGKMGEAAIPAGSQQLLFGDLNRDGRPEVIAVGPERSQAAVLQPAACAAPAR